MIRSLGELGVDDFEQLAAVDGNIAHLACFPLRPRSCQCRPASMSVAPAARPGGHSRTERIARPHLVHNPRRKGREILDH